MDRLNTILHSLRRRDNIRDFIDGLEDSECWPYPDGETRPIPAMIECCACCSEPFELEVNIRKEKIEELTHLYLTDIYRFHTFAPFGETSRRQIELADISIELCPEEGVGAYAVSYEAANEANRIGAPKMNLSDVAMIRSAFMHRYEWVVNKFHSVNRDRLEARKRFKAGDEHVAPSDEEQSEAALSEEEDHDAFLLNEGCVSPSRLTQVNIQADIVLRVGKGKKAKATRTMPCLTLHSLSSNQTPNRRVTRVFPPNRSVPMAKWAVIQQTPRRPR